MAEVISLVNQKGGVGKTTTAINLGACLAELGKYVLIVDIDPQGNATSGLGLDPQKLERNLYDALVSGESLKNVIHPTSHRRLNIVPAGPALAGANIELVNVEDREFRLERTFTEIRNDYDYIIIDAPPSLGLITVNGLVATDKVLIPVQSEYYALEGLGQLIETINMVKQNLKPELEILGAVITMFDKRNKLARQIEQELKSHFSSRIFSVVIPRNVKLSEAPSFGRSIISHDPWGKGAKAYRQLAEEFLATKKEKYTSPFIDNN